MDNPTIASLGFPVETAVCFTDHKGRPKKGMEKRQLKWLGKLAPLLRTLLHPGEKVLLTVPACSPMSILEQLTTGWVIYYIKRCQLVVTDRRILEVAVRRDLGPRLSVCEIEHAGVFKAEVSSFLSRQLRLRYRDGRSDVFSQLDSSMSAKLKAVLPGLLGQGVNAAPGRQHLCPRCAGRLQAPERCPHCFLEFKTRAKAVRNALLFPGGGYFYTGHPVLGTLDAIAELFLLLLLGSTLLETVSAGGSPETLTTLGFIALLLAFEKGVSVYHARHYVKEYLPADTTVTPVKAA